MYRAFYQQLTFAWLPAATTVFFVAFFAAVLLHLFLLKRRGDFQQVSTLPLDEEKHR
ncbi:MAG: CcoQ/FixQ family Cbb3-type cytochrome c oxidase assembly chaperone [Archangiaceae bacterium]|nr:CcoQ/FixQ family Cbb3-type cytochrome c oxidase assembly chaperone [Archangiaceae bacterium]